ncbi:MAG: ethanolamine ammonia-lyase subunit EutC [Oscillospiraceae bacterium]|jgi:ethanolamine ammonia-lyase small subunit|nr:ethanolamine ammonia-lyase subunit EutC [Oscillospiraceae bacterium]
MTNEALAGQIAAAVLAEMRREAPAPADPVSQKEAQPPGQTASGELMAAMKKSTSARIGVGRAGARLQTRTMLRLRADHAAARDAVLLDVSQGLLDRLQLPALQSCCASQTEFLTRPDLGRCLPEEGRKALQKLQTAPCDVLIFLADGLSSRAIEANAENLLPVLLDGVKAQGLTVGTAFFVRYGRVALMDQVAALTGARVVCVLIGERPGLGSAESMSAYLAYEPRTGMPEANRTVVSNIYSGGLAAVEAGAYIAELIGTIHKAGASGVQLRERGEYDLAIKR